MITKMTKYDFLVFHAQYDAFLEKLRNVGVLHVATLEEGDANLELVREKIALQARIDKQIETAQALIAAYNSAKGVTPLTPAPAGNLSLDEGLELLARFEALQTEAVALHQNVTAAERELQRMAPWGDYSAERLQRLADAGYRIGFYTCADRLYKPEWEEQYNAFVVNDSTNTTYFVTVTREPIADIEAETFEMSKLGSHKLQAELEAAQMAYAEKQAEIRDFAVANVEDLKRLTLQVGEIIDIDRVHINTMKAADNTVMLLEGYCPTDTVEALEAMLKEEGVYYESAEPTDEDNVPIKLRNNAFTRLFEPLTGMYGMPVYQEFDPTPVLAPFFLLFFAMCMGDGGYGVLLLLFGLAVKSGKIKIEMFDGLGSIIMVLGAATTVIGLFLGTAFGVNLTTLNWIPQGCKDLMITGKFGDTDFDIQMILALGIGVFHICLAMIIKAVGYTKRYGFMQNLSNWGWLLLILGGLIVAMLAVGEMVSVDAAKYALIAIGAISALGIYIFNDPKRNPLINIGAGLWDTYNMATGLLGDILSYIRLYALGLAGGMLGSAFNDLGAMILGTEPGIGSWAGFIVILILGHTLNLVMSALGAFVHPLRLTFVEYFKNAGYEGKGEKYTPLSRKVES
ncbi:MAG: ATPase V [Paludibacteraceae bacterium]|nr:ATPase V [Paludibacteraceae bacterium]